MEHAALALAIRLARRGARLTVVCVVDTAKALDESAASVLVDDPAKTIDALDANARRLLEGAARSRRRSSAAPRSA
jgi:nucleotide-binding universal stress UspA family protein